MLQHSCIIRLTTRPAQVFADNESWSWRKNFAQRREKFLPFMYKKKKSMEKLPVLKLLLTVQNSNQFSTSRLLFHEFWHTLESILTTQTAVRSASSFFVYIYSNRNVTSCTKRSQNKIRNQPFVDSSTPHNGAGSCHFANLTQRYKSDRV